MDFANKNCENCTQDIYEKTFRDLGLWLMIFLIGVYGY